MQSSYDASIRAIQPLPEVADNCISYPKLHSELSPALNSDPYVESSSEPLEFEPPRFAASAAQAEIAQPETTQPGIAQLQQALNFETLRRRIAELLHDGLDKAQIIQTAVRELTVGLGVRCQLALYDLDQGSSACYDSCYDSCYNYRENHTGNDTGAKSIGLPTGIPTEQDQATPFTTLPDLYRQLLQQQTVQFCLLESNPKPSLEPSGQSSRWSLRLICLAVPILDQTAERVIGALRLLKPATECFSSAEIELVRQAARQCAIALRQAERHRQAQAQIEALEQLHQRKDDFLNTVSHELRTPMSNIKMAIQLLEMNLEQSEPAKLTSARRYLQILKDESAREITLINDLLDLSRLEAGNEPLIISTVNPILWLPAVIEPFMARAAAQQQQFQADLATYLPPLTTDLGNLERILSELLNNACKYTPVGERIIFSVRRLKTPAQPPVLLFSVTNSGIEIPAAEQSRIFEKFYRIPSPDSWRQGGTGLGLALVKGLVEKLSGQIRVESYAGLTRFLVELPSRPASELEQLNR